MATIFAGGADVPEQTLRGLDAPSPVIAADSGAAAAHQAGLAVDHLVGDLDSITPDILKWVERSGATVHRYPADKDQTDLEIALSLATELGADRLLIVGGHGGRLDHLAANLALLADRRWPNPLTWLAGADRVEIVRGTRDLQVPVGHTLSVLAAEPARGVTIRGVRWPLTNANLSPGSTRGVSNIAESSPVTVSVEDGTLVVVIPEHTEPNPGS